EPIRRREDQNVVPLHVAVDEAVEAPFGAERVEQALEVLVLLQQRRQSGADTAEVVQHRMPTPPQGEDQRDLARQQLLQLLVLDQRARARVIEAEALAQHSSDLDGERLV